MVKIIKPAKYDSCLSCGESKQNLLRSFSIGRGDNIKTTITLCTACLASLVTQEMVYQPEE